MKNSQYKIDFISNTIIVTKKFVEAASRMDTEEYKTMLELRKMGMRIQTKAAAPRKATRARLSYTKMLNYIACVANSESYLADFQVIQTASKGQSNPYQYVRTWFDLTFPNYAALPELDENRRIVVTPAHYDSEDNAA